MKNIDDDKQVVRKPADRFLAELGVPFDDEGPYVVVRVSDASNFTSVNT